MTRGLFVAVLLAAVFTNDVRAQQIIKVPAHQPTIQAALGVAAPDDTVLVARGTYNERLIWPAVDRIRLISEEGAGVTIIDAQQTGRVVEMHGSLSNRTLLEGFTITGGRLTADSSDGAGMSVHGSPVIRSCVIRNNVAEGAIRNRGGGVFVESTLVPSFDRCVIEHNLLRGRENQGAGVAVATGSPSLDSCIVRNNSIIGGNIGTGAGLHLDGLGPSLRNTFVHDNEVTQCSSYARGAGVYVNAASPRILACTIHRNRLTSSGTMLGAGIYIDRGARLDCRNTIVSHNSPEGIRRASSLAPITGYNNVWNNTGGNYIGLTAASSSISVDPMFVGTNDLHLQAGSPCVDTGLPGFRVYFSSRDRDGDPRPTDGDLDGAAGNGAVVDIGADEYVSARLTAVGNAQMGTVLTLQTSGPPASAHALALGFATDANRILPYGVLYLANPATLAIGGGPLSVNLQIPVIPGLEGTRFYTQGLVWPLTTATVGNLTNVVESMGF